MFVAQIGNLLCRRMAFGSGPTFQGQRTCSRVGGLPVRDTADCHSALRFAFPARASFSTVGRGSRRALIALGRNDREARFPRTA
jgi:hypothetical protein